MTLKLGAAGVIPDASTVTLSGTATATTLDLNGFDETIGSLSSGNTGSLILLGAKTLTLSNGRSSFSGTISGTGSLVKNGTSGTPETLNGANTYTGNTFINSGMVRLGAVNGIPAASPVIMGANAILDVNNFSPTLVALSGGGRITNNGVLTVNGNLTGT